MFGVGRNTWYGVIGFVSCFLVFRRSAAVEIGFVPSFWVVGTVAVGFVCLESPLAMLIEQVSRLWAAALRSAARHSGCHAGVAIGFVSHIWIVGQAGVGVNWVRSVKTAFG